MRLQFTLSKLLFLILLSLSLLASTNSFAQTQAPQGQKINIGLIYPVSTNGTTAAADTNIFSFNLLAGLSAGERGFTFAGFSNVVRYDAAGMQFAGFSNHIGQKAEGMMFAGFLNTYREAKGLQFAGFANVSVAESEGAQFAGFLNTAGDVKGAQFAGFANIARNITGPQASGFTNVAARLKGSQFAGFANIADDVKGSQFAGFINVARKVSGVQVAGFINIADSSDHPLGFINIIKNGEQSVGFTFDDTETGILAFRSGGRRLYGILGAGYNFKNENEVYAFELGLGAHLINTRFFRLNTEISSITLEDFHAGEYFRGVARLMPSIRPSRNLDLFGGPVFNYVNTNTTEGPELTPKYIRTWENRWGNNFQGIYIGYAVGINIIL